MKYTYYYTTRLRALAQSEADQERKNEQTPLYGLDRANPLYAPSSTSPTKTLYSSACLDHQAGRVRAFHFVLSTLSIDHARKKRSPSASLSTSLGGSNVGSGFSLDIYTNSDQYPELARSSKVYRPVDIYMFTSAISVRILVSCSLIRKSKYNVYILTVIPLPLFPLPASYRT